MLHELLISLRGHSGYIFIDNEVKMTVNPTLPFLHPCEVAILNSLLELGTDYRTLQAFIAGGGGVNEDNEAGPGIYHEAVCQGLDLVLDGYRDTLSQLEKEILYEGDSFPLTMVQHRLSPHRPVLRYLVKLVTAITREQPRGVMILDTCYKASTCGVSEVGVAIRRVLAEGHKVLYKQLLAWLLQGALYDPHQEFFIVKKEGEESLLVGDEPGDTVMTSKSGSYKLLYDMVPSHISHSLAEKIFFIGESIQLFESDNRVDVQGEVLQQRETELYQALSELRDREEFVLTEFGKFVDKIRDSVSVHLYQLVVGECDLMAELRMVWDVFTMGRGELFHAFIHLADRRLSSPPTPATQHDTNQAWSSALLQHTDTEDSLMTRVTVLVARDQPHVSGWDQLSLQYAVPWPLHLVITPQALEKYNQIFKFLLLARRTQSALHNLWADHIFSNRSQRRRKVAQEEAGGEEKDDTDIVAQTRQHMVFLVDNIQYYLMADVLDTQISGLKTKLDKTSSFEDVKMFHDQFLTQIQASIFLFNDPVHKCLVDTMNVCLKFTASTSLTSQKALSTAFSHHSFLLLKLLTSLRHQMAPTSLAQLLTRIDYNRYFSKKEKKSNFPGENSSEK